MLNNRKFKDYIPLITFAVLLVVFTVLYLSWSNGKILVITDLYDIAATLYIYPLIFIFGTSSLLFMLELFGLISVRRIKAIRIVLLSLISLMFLWIALFFAYTSRDLEEPLLGEGIQKFIAILPAGLFKYNNLWRFISKHYFDYIGFIGCELIGICLFLAIGRAASKQELENAKLNYRKTRSIISFPHIIIFSALFVLSILGYLVINRHSGLDFDPFRDRSERIAVAVCFGYIFPINCILGSAIFLYCAELLGVLNIRRNKSVRIILLLLISLTLIWGALLVTSLQGKLFGEGVYSFISNLPDWLLSTKVSYFVNSNIKTAIGMLFYELLGIGLFLAIGPKNNNSLYTRLNRI